MINNVKSAFSSIWNNKITSLLTMLGVVIGVTSVIVLISLGQGLKNDVSGLIEGLGSNIMAVIGGKIDTENLQSSNQQINPAQLISSDILTENDIAALKKTKGVKLVIPMTMVSYPIKYQNKIASATVIGTTSQFLEAVNLLKIGEGRAFQDFDEKTIIIPYSLKDSLFSNTDPIGKKINLGPQEFTIVGVFKKISGGALSSEYSNMSLIPFDSATSLNKNQVKIFRIMIKCNDGADVKVVKKAVRETLLTTHKGEENFTVLTQDDLLGLIDKFLNLATTLVSAIAAISLIVGGIGIMNIMLITVTERTKEIGLRKAVGASKLAILMQFLIEAIIITLMGGLIGLIVSYITTYIISSKTSLNPDINQSTVVLALGISALIGIIFGIWPAFRAAQKDPIEALRRE